MPTPAIAIICVVSYILVGAAIAGLMSAFGEIDKEDSDQVAPFVFLWPLFGTFAISHMIGKKIRDSQKRRIDD